MARNKVNKEQIKRLAGKKWFMDVMESPILSDESKVRLINYMETYETIGPFIRQTLSASRTQ